MASYNKVTLLGNLTRDPELKYTPKGSAVCEISLALNRQYTTDGGERMEEVTYVDVTLWGRTAEIANQYLTKGRPVFIDGRLQLDTWEDKQTGQKRSRLRVVGETLQLLGGRDGGGGGGNARQGGGRRDQGQGRGMDEEGSGPSFRESRQDSGRDFNKNKPAAPSFSQDFDDDDDVPF